jgi:hypothetical protein
MIYRATVSESFWQLEMIQTALNIKDKQIENLRKYIVESEFLDYTTANNLNKKLGALVKRFAVLDIVLIEELAQADTKTAEFITFYSIVKNERIVYDFLNEIIFSNFMKLKKYITKDEIDNFMTEKARQIEEVENWTESSRKRMKNKIVEFCLKGGYLSKDKEDYLINIPSVGKRVKEHLKKIESIEINNILFLQKEI